MSVFAQYVPYTLAEGTWDERREEIGDRVLAAVSRFAPDVLDVVEEREVLGPPDIEARIGLTGGHIFQGSCLPARCGTAACPHARRSPASTSAAPPPTRAAASSPPTAATRPWPSSPTRQQLGVGLRPTANRFRPADSPVG